MKMYVASERHKEMAELITMADNHAQAHENERALAFYAQALELMQAVAPDEPGTDQVAALHNAVAALLVQMGQWRRAREELNHVLGNQAFNRGERARALVMNAQVSACQGRYSDAIREIEQVVSEVLDDTCSPIEHAMAHLERGTLLARSGEIVSGAESLEKARRMLEAAPMDRESAALLAGVYLQQGVAAFREHQLEEARKLYDRSLALLEEHAPGTVFEADGHRYVGVLYSLQGQNLKALQEHLKALDIYKRVQNPLGHAKTFNSIGQTCLEMSRLDEALFFMRKAQQMCRHVGAEAELATIYGKLGAIYVQREEYDRAVEFQLKDVELSRRFGNDRALAFATRNLGLSYHAKGEFDESMHYLRESLQLFEELDDPVNRIRVHLDLGRCWLDRGDTIDAEVEAEKAMALLADRPTGVDTAQGTLLMGSIHRLNHNFEQAKRKFDEALMILGEKPSLPFAEAHFGLGQLNYEMRNHARAVDHLKQVVRTCRELGQKRLLDRTIPLLERIDDTELVKLLIEDVESLGR